MPKTWAATEGMSHAELCVSLPKVRTIYMRKWGDFTMGRREKKTPNKSSLRTCTGGVTAPQMRTPGAAIKPASPTSIQKSGC